MSSEAELTNYMNAIREDVCSHCVERPYGGPPCAPLGKQCGVELHLPEIIDAIHQQRSDLLEPYLRTSRQEVCEKCALHHSSVCPCPMDYLAALLVESVENVDLAREEAVPS